jgi:hypothetical protein
VVNGLMNEVVRLVKSAGYKCVALYVQRYRTGSMNEVLDKTACVER